MCQLKCQEEKKLTVHTPVATRTEKGGTKCRQTLQLATEKATASGIIGLSHSREVYMALQYVNLFVAS